MTFSEFLNQFMSGFSGIISHIPIYFSMLLENYFVRIVIYSSMIGLVFWLIFEIFNIFQDIFDGDKNKKTSKNSKIE